MLPDWVDELGLALSIIATSGILILVRQWYIDHHSRQPFKLDSLGGGWTAMRLDGTGQLGLRITNRRSIPTTISLLLGVPKGKRGVQSLPSVRLMLLPLGNPYLPGDQFELAGKVRRQLLLDGALPVPEYAGDLRLMISDSEGGRYILNYRLSQAVGEVPPNLVGKPPRFGLRAAGDFGGD